MIKAVLFDLDGVLVDTEGIYTEFWGKMDSMFPTGVDNFAQVIKGSTLSKILTTYFPAPDTQEKIRAMLADQEHNMEYHLFPGVMELMAQLKERGIKTAIVTSSNREKMRHLFTQLPALEAAIDTLVTDEDVTASKPDPQGYLLAAGRLGAGKGEFIVVEDSLAGLEAGRRSGAIVAGLTTTNPLHKVEPMADIVADEICRLDASAIAAM